MGGCFSVSMSCDQSVNQVSQWLRLKGSYIHNLPENLASLEKAMGLLKAKRDDVQERVTREEFTGRHRSLAQVKVWLTAILTIENDYNDLFNTSKMEIQRLCLCGLASKDLKLSYRYGKRVIRMLREIESLISQGGEFHVVTEEALIADVEKLHVQPTIVGQETMLERVWNRLTEDKVGIVALYGMGGVGKTTLLTQINNKFSKISGRFDVVIWVVVSKSTTIHKIQGDIGRKLGLSGKEWDEKSEDQRVDDIHNILRMKKFVLLLDDIWEKVNLHTIGVPYPSSETGSKVAFTTRSRDVCGRMGVDDPIEVRCLDTDKAWDLFKEKVGENTLGSDPEICKLARQVAGKCRGLPLALSVIGETMACKSTVQEWQRAVDVLTSCASELLGVEDEILPILKYSYDGLKGEHVKSCFLYCSLFPEDYMISKERLIEYWICEGFIDEKQGRDKAFNQGYEILGTLVRACLLLEGDGEKLYVKMHDVVREMAHWISSELGKHKERCIVQAGVGLRQVPEVKDWRAVRRMSLMMNDIEKISESHDCPELTTLLLGENGIHEFSISGEFFRSMPRLLVLDLSRSRGGFLKLPKQISRLVSLRYLDLSDADIRRLPDGLYKLKKLIHLNLESIFSLESLKGISKLSDLRTLRLQNSGVQLDKSLMKELQCLEHLEFISIDISSSLVGELLLYDPRVGRCIQQISIRGDGKESAGVLVLPAMDTLRNVVIVSCKTREIKVEKTPWNTSPPCFSNLSYLTIMSCSGLKDLTWLLFAPNLTSLELLAVRNLEDIISKETCNIMPFQKLEVLYLEDMYELKSIYWTALPFQRLRRLEIHGDCPKLRKLPLDSKSVFNIDQFVIRCSDAILVRSKQRLNGRTKPHDSVSYPNGNLGESGDMHELKSIYWTAMPFQRLEICRNCPKPHTTTVLTQMSMRVKVVVVVKICFKLFFFSCLKS